MLFYTIENYVISLVYNLQLLLQGFLNAFVLKPKKSQVTLNNYTSKSLNLKVIT